MALTSFATPLTAAPLDNLVISNNNGVGYSFADPGIYSLICNVPWYYHADDSQAIADMTAVDAGETVTVTVTTSTATKYCKTAIRGEFDLRITYDAPTPQNYDAELQALADLSITAAGLALLDDAAASNQRTTLGATSVGNAVFIAANAAAARTAVGAVIGTDVQAYSANLDEYAAVNPTAAGLALLDDAAATNQRTTLGLAIGTDVQAYSANLDEYAAVNPTAAGLALLDDADAAAQRTTLGLDTAAVQSYATAAFTPAFAGSGDAGAFTYEKQTGYYTRVGNRVWYDITLQISAITTPPTGDLKITGLPIAVVDYHAATIGWRSGITQTATYSGVGVSSDTSGTVLYVGEFKDGAGGIYLPAANLGAAAFLVISGSYRVAV